MKKLLVIALVVVLALSVVAFVACGEEETYTGYCYYSTQYGGYGCVVDVTVKNNRIIAVKLYTDAEAAAWAAENNVTWDNGRRTTLTWQESTDKQAGDEGYQLGATKTEAGYAAWIEDEIVGQKVAAVQAWVASATSAGQTVGEGVTHMVGATQSSARVIVAIQNALAQINAGAAE